MRHAFVPVFDMPIEIANPGKSLSTHTFTALRAHGRRRAHALERGVDAADRGAGDAGRHQEGRVQAATAAAAAKNVRGAVVTSDSSNATDALDRVTIPQEAIDRISELLTPGSSLIISDEGLGRETGRYTEFIVETR